MSSQIEPYILVINVAGNQAIIVEHCKILGSSQKLFLNTSFLNTNRMLHFNFSNIKIFDDKSYQKRLCQKYNTVSFQLQNEASYNQIAHWKKYPYLWAGALNHGLFWNLMKATDL